MAKVIEGTHPTRMELQFVRKRTKLAKKGHKLMKEKRDALVMEFLKVIDHAKGVRDDLAQSMDSGYGNLIKAESMMGSMNVKAIADALPYQMEAEFGIENVMGVRVPKAKIKEREYKGWYGLTFTSSKLDEATRDFDDAAKKVLRLIENEEKVRRIGTEIKKTKRRVNSLEYIMIPNLRTTQRYIKMRLEEMERENFFRLKTVKKKKAKAKAMLGN
ncbi:MAG: hypothetical protein MSIBF_06070 [Candidatus Altiarchaeales archaeon IMC4]|nr:MAG: hypothetical protein MSIBF_06070 [Candidatus Altiarchaeales archaeon IMC4]